MKYRVFVCAMTIMCQTMTVFAGEMMTKKAWLAGYQNILPAAICKEEGYFRSCYKISGEECHALATAKTNSCSLQYSSQLPELFRQPEDGTDWGTKIGVCVGNMMGEALAKKKFVSNKCNDPNAWK